MGLACVAVLLVVHLGPEGMPDRLCSPCDARLPEARGTWETPVPPGLLAAPCGHGRHASLFWQVCCGSRACALCATGDEEAGREARARPRERLEAGAGGRALGP